MKVVCFKWEGDNGRNYASEHANRLYDALQKNVKTDFSLCCVTDKALGLSEEIDVYNMPESCRKLAAIATRRFAKLFIFSDDFSRYIGDKFVYLDLDVIIVGDFSPLEKQCDAALTVIAGGGDKSRRKKISYFLRHGRFPKTAPVNSSVMVVQPFSNAELWNGFDLERANRMIMEKRISGSDQAWIYLCAKKRLAYLGREEGVYRASTLAGRQKVPDDAKIVFFPGPWAGKPWMEDALVTHPWMAEFQ